MVEILLGLIRASREGNWMLHLAMIKAVISWMFAYDGQNYAKYLPVYYNQMLNLLTEHPEVCEHLTNGGNCDSWGRQTHLDVYLLIKLLRKHQTKTRRQQRTGMDLVAVSKYYLTTEYRSIRLRNLREIVHEKPPGVSHADLEPALIKR